MNIKNRVHYGVAFLFAALLVMPAGQALATEVSKGVQVGLLECHTVEGSGFSLLVHSTSDVTCRFEAAGGGVSATVGIGAGVQTLVGGGNRSISLQPAISGSKGAGVSGGAAYLYLEADR